MHDYMTSLADPGSMIPLTLLQAREVMMDRIRPILQQYGLTEVQWRVMRVLYIKESVDFGELSDLTLVQRASLSRVIPTMVDKGLLIRDVNPEDQRLITLTPTERVSELVEHIMPRIQAVYDDVADRIGDPGFAKFRSILDTFIRDGRAGHEGATAGE